jgi:3,4-dihydroxy 2-butanone 4-phosphate synthase/GTP cyclohydrolase II
MPTAIDRVEQALRDFAEGKMVILVDDPEREDEGDLIIPAEKITPDIMNFMIRHGSGIVCLAITPEFTKRLHLPLMVPSEDNSSLRGTPFTISIDARDGITTGVSAADRTRTVEVAISDTTKPDDLVKPGHIFPLEAKEDGVMTRQGHTEGSVDLARIGGFKAAAVICEIMNPDGTMTRGKQLLEFAAEHHLNTLSIDDIIFYRIHHEYRVEDHATTTVPLAEYGEFELTVVKEKSTQLEHLILKKAPLDTTKPTLVRIHSACATGDIFYSLRCDCHEQLHYALKRISEEGGVLIYLQQEGRGIGLLNKIKAYQLQENGLDTVEANQQLNLPIDARSYSIAANLLHQLKIARVRLLTHNPDKVNSLIKYGITDVVKEDMPIFQNNHNVKYLTTKSKKLNHTINLGTEKK